MSVLDFTSRQGLAVGTPDGLGFLGSFTFMCWVKIGAFSNIGGDSFDNAIIAQSNATANKCLHIVVRQRRPHFGFYCNDTAGTTVMEENKWYHLACSYNLATQTQSIFVNGKLDSSTGGHTPLQHSNDQCYLSRYVRGRPLCGKLSPPLLWRAALTETEIRKLMFVPENGDAIRAAERVHGSCRVIKPAQTMATDESLPILDRASGLKFILNSLPHVDDASSSSDRDRTPALSEFHSYYDSPELSDVTLRCHDRKLHGHRIVLATRSGFFAGMFRSKMREAGATEVDLSELLDNCASNVSGEQRKEEEEEDDEVGANAGGMAIDGGHGAADRTASVTQLFRFLALLYAYPSTPAGRTQGSELLRTLEAMGNSFPMGGIPPLVAAAARASAAATAVSHSSSSSSVSSATTAGVPGKEEVSCDINDLLLFLSFADALQAKALSDLLEVAIIETVWSDPSCVRDVVDTLTASGLAQSSPKMMATLTLLLNYMGQYLQV